MTGLYDPAYEHDACGVGFVVNVNGKRSHDIVQKGLTVLRNLDHRGAVGADPFSGDGAGILLQLPHRFFQKVCNAQNVTLPAEGRYGVGMIFGSIDQRAIAEIVIAEGQKVIGWRRVPVDSSSLGPTARSSMPEIWQVFIEGSPSITSQVGLERKLYLIRRRLEKEHNIYAASLSSRTIVYKGMLTPEQLSQFYPDLSDPDMVSALSLVHSRFSTNTFPSWERAQPARMLAHNGEINTLRGNVNWMNARQSLFSSKYFGADLARLMPVIDPDGSDSAMADNCLEFLNLNGYSLPHGLMMMIPEPWAKHESMSTQKKAFYEYHSCLMEPWDGPAVIAFSDGVQIGAVLDRNGLRPSRYYVLQDGLVIMASEVGVIDVNPAEVVQKGRLQPGRMLLVDTSAGQIVSDQELKADLAGQRPYEEWLAQHVIDLDKLPGTVQDLYSRQPSLVQRQQAFGYSFEELKLMLTPMVTDGIEPVGSMGTDIPLAVLSEQPQLLYSYFKQLFAQVTNPAIDAIREEVVTDTQLMLGSEGNLLQPGPENCRRIRIKTPFLTNEQLAALKHIKQPGFSSAVLPILFAKEKGAVGLEQALEGLYDQVDQLVDQGVNLLILSDRAVCTDRVPIPALLAVAGVHHHLIQRQIRAKVDIILESGEPREVHHMALLLGYGAGAINPYLAYETVRQLVDEGKCGDIKPEKALANYRKALLKGVVKVMSKMGISTIQSYCGAQIFEAVGLSRQFVDRFFVGTPSRLEGIGLTEIAAESLQRHAAAFTPGNRCQAEILPSRGEYQWRGQGEKHLFSPETIYHLQMACRSGDYQEFKRFSQLINNDQRLVTLRGLLGIKTGEPIPLDDVEPVESIVRRFKTGAMSYGSISREAHECLAIAMNRLGGKSNTGEGGEDPERFRPKENGDSSCSAIKQVASGRFGVTSEYLVNAKEIQIKIAQGAKPGEGGQLPGRKVYPWVAKVRHSTPGVGLISPPPHHDIYSIEDLAQLIHDLKNANSQARISVKLVSAVGVGTIAAGVAKGKADVVLISGYDGGTGASPRSSIRHAGLPWELGLAETHQTLLLNRLRSRIAVETDGKLLTGRDVAIAALLGAEEFGFATGPLVALGCVMMRVCNLDTCPAGIATQNPELRAKFKGRPEWVENFMRFIAQELREIMAQLGFRTLNEMVGRVDKLYQRSDINHWKAKKLDLRPLLQEIALEPGETRYCSRRQDHNLEKSLDRRQLLALGQTALKSGQPVKAALPIANTDRVVGTMLGSSISRRFGADGLPEDAIDFTFTGSAGQSFGAFVPRGVTLTLIGDANDYIGKGLSGGRIIVCPPPESPFRAEENVIIGNVAFYGATGGEAFIRGQAGERFCVRNSGLKAVVEGVGDHGCEYMTGGQVVILGAVGRNFAAGMSGGIAYVYDPEKTLANHCYGEGLLLESFVDQAEADQVRNLIEKHRQHTSSVVAQEILANWETARNYFVRVIPKDYKRMLQAFKRLESAGLGYEEAVMAAFTENSQDQARISGN